MTVCIAALAERNILIGVSDRMLTSGGDTAFEPEQGKYWAFSNSIIALISGDAAIQGELMRQVDIEMKSWMRAEPNSWVSVKSVASLYCQKFREMRRQKAEEEILYPLGLDLQTYLYNQGSLGADLVNRLSTQLIEYEFPAYPNVLETIFLGIDTDGPLSAKAEKLSYPHIYVTTNDKLTWHTTIGFAAIGIGRLHAESQLTYSGHSPMRSFSETVLLTYAAKRRAEAAPGVGKSTDFLIIGPKPGTVMKVDDKHVQELDKIYRKTRQSSTKATQIAEQETAKLIERVQKEFEERAEKEKQKEKDKADKETKNTA